MTIRKDSEFLGKNVGLVTKDSLTRRGPVEVGVTGTEIAMALESKVGVEGHILLEVFSRIDKDGNIGQVNTYNMKDGSISIGTDRFQIIGHEEDASLLSTEILFGKISGFGVQVEEGDDKRESVVFEVKDFNAVYRLTRVE